jgi:hypothetical protein
VIWQFFVLYNGLKRENLPINKPQQYFVIVTNAFCLGGGGEREGYYKNEGMH